MNALDVLRAQREARRPDLAQKGQRIGEPFEQRLEACREAIVVRVAEMDDVVPGAERIEQRPQLVPAGAGVAAIGDAEESMVEVARAPAVRQVAEEEDRAVRLV